MNIIKDKYESNNKATLVVVKKTNTGNFSHGPVVKNLPSNAGNKVKEELGRVEVDSQNHYLGHDI